MEFVAGLVERPGENGTNWWEEAAPRRQQGDTHGGETDDGGSAG